MALTLERGMDGWGAIAAWAVDFIRAYRERPWLCRIVFRLLVGRYAYREFIGLMNALEDSRHFPRFGYGLEGCDYHKDRVPWRWWI